jgi:phosphatidylinositol alpha-mannosyltransferase
MSMPRWAVLLLYQWVRWQIRGRQVMPARRTIAASDWSVEKFDAWAGIHAVALPYAVDLEMFTPPAQPSRRRPYTALHVGRLDPRKNLATLLDAWDIVVADLPEARLELVGGPGYAPEVLRLLDGRRGVEWIGIVARGGVIDRMRQTAVLVQVSAGENFGTAVAEGLACGMTCVTGPDNGTNAYLDENSIVATSYDPADIARALTRALRHASDFPVECSRSSRESAVTHFDAGRIADRLENWLL